MKKLLFIFNPTAGKTRILSKLSDIIDFYTKQGYLVTAYPTQSQKDGYEFLKNLQDSYDKIVCSGGDGTLNEVVSGILENGRNLTLGYLPLGSTNDFARSVGIPMEFGTALDTSVNGREYPVDVGKVNERHFVYVAAFGMFTDIPYVTSQKMKNSLGYLAYFLEGIKSLSELKAFQLDLEYNGQKESGEFIIGMITNSVSVGGFKYPIKRNIKFNDGLFEVLLIRMPRSLMDLQAIVSGLLSEKVETKYMLFIQTSSLKIHAKSLAWTLDGEYGGTYDEMEITNLKSAISIMIPRE